MSQKRTALPVFLTAPLGIALLGMVVACSADLRSTENTEAVPPDAEQLWQHLGEQNYREEWALWPGKGEKYKGTEPHGMLLTTYLNPAAEQAVEQRPGEMPNDAVIVKENYMPDGTLAAVTTMHKVEGFNPEHGDWYFVKFDPSGKAEEKGKAEGCIACHSSVSGNDYIFTGPVR